MAPPAVTHASRNNSGEGLAMAPKLRNLYQAPKIDIKINVHGKRDTYTTLDQIDGSVTITAHADVSFDDIEIEFLGTSHAYVERLTTAAAVSGRSEAFHQFLKLTQPRLRQHYPTDLVLRAGRTYALPFVFVIPQQLLPRVCQHRVDAPSLRDAHLTLPPTFGDKDSRPKGERTDDMAPDMASIRYGVFVRISKMKIQNDETVKSTLASKARRLRVIPTTHELPPMEVTGSEEYSLRKEKSIRKGMLKGKQGTLVMEAAQPPSLRLHASKETQSQTMATIMLRFDPAAEDSLPPRIGTLISKLKVHTYFASTARHSYPSRAISLLDLAQGLHTDQIQLSSRCMASVEWTKHDPTKTSDTPERRDSAVSTTSFMHASSTSEPSLNYKGGIYHTARLLVPISLPSNKTFVPTFHTCLISRVYLLKLELGLSNAAFGSGLDLRVPLQIAYDGSQASDAGLQRNSSVDSAMETPVSDDDVADFFEPRTIRAPSEAFVGRSRLGSAAPLSGGDDAPPGYEAFAPTAHPSVSVH